MPKPAEFPEELRILVVDDDEIERLTLRRHLSKTGLRVELEEREDARAAVLRVAAQRFDCILADLRLAGADGLWLLREIRALEQQGQAPDRVPIVILTSFGDELIAVEAMKAGATDYVPKANLTPERLCSILRTGILLEGQRAATQRAHQSLAEAHRELERRVADRTAALTEANRELAHLAAIVSSSSDAIISQQLDGTITAWNRGAESLLGYPLPEVLGQPLQNLFPPAARSRLEESLRRLLETGAAQRFATMALPKSQKTFAVSVSLCLVADPEGTALGISAILRDISERIEAEAVILAKNKDLETLLHVISHDLREPLRTIKSFSEILLERQAGNLDEKGKDHLRRIGLGVERMNRLIADILELSQAMRMTAPREELPLDDVAAEVLAAMQSQIKAAQGSVRIGLGLPKVRVDRFWITRALYNLLSNALKFTVEGRPPEVEIVPFLPQAGEAGQPGLMVRDRGPGVPEELRERIFTLFQRGVCRKVEGTGAGLAIVREIAIRHGGWAWMRPRFEGGSDFILTVADGPVGGSFHAEYPDQGLAG